MTFGLPRSPLELLGREAYWAGNLNVFIGERAMERHMTQPLRVYPGRTNLAAFFVGHRPDSYQFGFSSEDDRWDARLLDASFGSSLLHGLSTGEEIPTDKWVRCAGTRVVLLVIDPPSLCFAQKLEVHVTQQSTGRTAIVEFTLDPEAPGAGCYALG